MLKSIKKNKDGFTIIEVLIVLAIAALILVIVFLAVQHCRNQLGILSAELMYRQ